MKALVAATCVAILATIGYLFWGEYSEAKRLSEAQQLAEKIRSCEAARASGISPGVVKRCLEQGYLR